jgi:hypothetical protein
MRIQFLVVGAALALAAVGCGGVTYAPVSGRVTLDDAPLANANVVFEPVSSEKNPGPASIGTTDAQGNYSLQLMQGQNLGARVGKHKVSIVAYEGGSEMGFRKLLVPERYNSKTILTFEVPEEGTTTANFALKSLPPEK